MKYEIKINETLELSDNTINEILEIKNQRWSYGISSQKEWFEKNIDQNDYHFLIYSEDKLLAYANLVCLKVLINHQLIDTLGLGNVCTSTLVSNQGFGKLLMASINMFLKKSNKSAFLLCKQELIDFYKLNNWILLDCKKVLFNGEVLNHIVMYYNLESRLINEVESITFNRVF